VKPELRGVGDGSPPPRILDLDSLAARHLGPYREALQRYGQHRPDCDTTSAHCTCGWTATWRRLSCPPDKEEDR